MAVEFERAMWHEAPRLSIRILRVDRLAVAPAQLLNGELFDPNIFHNASVICTAGSFFAAVLPPLMIRSVSLKHSK